MLSRFEAASLLSGTAVYLLANVVNAVIPFALLPILTRHLRPAEYGEIAMFQTLLGALGAFVGLGAIGAAARKFYDGETDTAKLRSFIAGCLQILAASTVVALLAALAFGGLLSGFLGLAPGWIVAGVLASALSMVVQLRLNQWQVRNQAAAYGVLQISQSALNLLLSVVLVVGLSQGAGGRIGAHVAVTVIFGIVSAALLKRDGLFSFTGAAPQYIREALAFGVPLIPHVAGGFLLTTVDRLVINAELGLHEAGIYMVAAQLTSAIGLVLASVQNAYVPWLFERLKRDNAQEKRMIVKHTYRWFLALLVVVVLAFLVGPPLVALIAGPQYAQAGEIVGWLALGQAFSGMYLMVTTYVFYGKRTGILSMTTITSGALNILLLVVLIRMFGLPGAAIAYSIAMGVRFLLTWFIAQKSHPMPWLYFELGN